MAQWVGFDASETTFGREVRAGVTTFMAMAYILFVNPQILTPAVVSPGAGDMGAQLLSATALAAAFGSILMGVLGRMPIALAPGMGLNAYFTYSVVLGHGMPWQTALGAVFVSGVIFLVLTMSGIREAVINAIPLSIKRASAAGIGMFLALIGLQAGGIVACPWSDIDWYCHRVDGCHCISLACVLRSGVPWIQRWDCLVAGVATRLVWRVQRTGSA
jgi:AGZA family xanthine/uracil permease-like MFS transporter